MLDAYQVYMDRVKRAMEQEEPKNEASTLKHVRNNVIYGLMSSRAGGPVSLVGSSVGGALDGVLMKPVIDAGIDAAGKGVRWAYGLKNEPSASL
jgi:predicted alpha/beta-hydrolase family hydrolase